jgi:hypothetical protein
MISNDAYKAIANLDLEPIKLKLMHVQSGEGWDMTKATAVETEYRRFLYLMHAFPDEQTSPLVDVDTFWHYHILDTMKYAADCQAAFGYFMHHYPYVGFGEPDGQLEVDAGAQRMRELYERVFGEPYAQAASAWCTQVPSTVEAKSAWCTHVPSTVKAKAAWCTHVPSKVEVKAAWPTAPSMMPRLQSGKRFEAELQAA